jgi:hypothetical protein
MRSFLISTTLVAMLVGGLMAVSSAQKPAAADEGPTPAFMLAADAGPVALVAPVAVEPVAPEATALEDAAEIKRAALELRDADWQGLGLWFALLAALTHLLLTGIKKVMKLTTRGKRWLPWVALGLGVLTGFFGAYTGNIATAIAYGAGPPLAVIAQELGYGKLGALLLDGLKAVLGRGK